MKTLNWFSTYHPIYKPYLYAILESQDEIICTVYQDSSKKWHWKCQNSSGIDETEKAAKENAVNAWKIDN